MGNSQLNGINNYQKGDLSSPILLSNQLEKKNFNLLAFAYPNLSLVEAHVLITFLISEVKVNSILLPLFFDDTREINIRSEIYNLLKIEQTRKELSKSLLVNKILKTYKADNTKKKKKNIKSITEEKIKYFLDESTNWAEKNKQFRGKIFSNLYKLRNTVFRIKPTTVRKLIPFNYNQNIDAFKETLNFLRSNQTNFFVYIPPIRNDLKIPYNANEYNKFKNEVKSLVEASGYNLLNYERVIPNHLWGKKSSTNFRFRFD